MEIPRTDEEQINSLEKMIKRARKSAGEQDINQRAEGTRKSLDNDQKSPPKNNNTTKRRKLKIRSPTIKRTAVDGEIIVKPVRLASSAIAPKSGSATEPSLRTAPLHPLNEMILRVLEQLIKIMKKNRDFIHLTAYRRALDTVQSITEDITDIDDLKGKRYIGPIIIEKLKEYQKTGTLRLFEREKEKPDYALNDVYEQFSQIFGVGPKKAKDLIDAGVTSMDQLRERQDELLTASQRAGLKYYNDILQRIPRAEIDDFGKQFNDAFLAANSPDAKYEIVGSYRRGLISSGDIDVIVTANEKEMFKRFTDNLVSQNIILETLSCGGTKCLVIARLPNHEVARRVDFMYTTPAEYPFAILYFTGSKEFNTVMRSHALKLGFSLNEHGLYKKEKNQKKEELVDHVFMTEEDIFDYLHLKFVKPVDRVNGDVVKTSDVITTYTDVQEVIIDEPILPTVPKVAKTKKIREPKAPKVPKAHKEPKTKKIREPKAPKVPNAPKEPKTKKIREPKAPKAPKTKKIREPKAPKLPKAPKAPKETKTRKIREPKKRIKIGEIIDNNTIEAVNIEQPEIPIVPIITAPTIEAIKPNKIKIKKPMDYENNIKIITESNKMKENVNNADGAKQTIIHFKETGITVLENLSEAELANLLTVANDAYYNSKTSLLTDNEYDIIKEYMETKYPKNEVLAHIGAPVTRNKVKLPYNMPSMDKIKPDTNALSNWMKKYTGPYELSCKLDGVSGMYSTEGDVPKLYTRGDGMVGQDITHLLRVLKLPNVKGFVVRGEFIISKRVFNEKYKNTFANPRNLVSGIINSKTIDEKTNDLHFVAYEIIQPQMKPSEQYAKLTELGFEVVYNKIEDKLTNELLSDMLIDLRAKHEYEIDGIIVCDDKVHIRRDGNPEYAFAFKMVMSDQMAEVKVIDVIWTPSKSGYLKPRVRIEPIHLGGVTIEYATGFNGNFIETNKIGIGALIMIIRSGDVIPHIKSVTVPAEKAKMPIVPYHWTDTHVDIVLDNISEDVEVIAKNITAFFVDLGVDGLSGGNVKRIINAGYDSIPKILKMEKVDFAKVEGFKDKMVEKVFSGIKTKVQQAPLINIMAASNLFGRGIGVRKISPIIEAYPDILTRPETDERKIAMLIGVNGVGPETAKLFVNNIATFIQFLKDCDLEYKLANKPLIDKPLENTLEPIDISHPLYQKHIVMTKVRDATIIDGLKRVGGVLDDAMTKNTYALIVKIKDDVSNKTKYAVTNNIPIFTPAEFIEKYKLFSSR